MGELSMSYGQNVRIANLTDEPVKESFVRVMIFQSGKLRLVRRLEFPVSVCLAGKD